MKQLSENLLTRLTQADVVCKDCGFKYGKYSVGCSSVWVGRCNVCGEEKPVTEVRDYGYLAKGITDEKEKIRKQSAEVANYMLSVGPIMNDDELDGVMMASYEEGEITCKFTEEEVTFLNSWLDTVEDLPGPEEVAVWETVSQKIYELYEHNCVKYELSPALVAYNKKYGTWGTGEDEARWEGFRDAYALLKGE